MENYDAILENWYIDLLGNVLYGNVYFDSKNRFKNGDLIHTSKVLNPETFGELDIIQTRNTKYLLGRKHEIY